MIEYLFDTDNYKVTKAVPVPRGNQLTFNAFLDRDLSRELYRSQITSNESREYQELGEEVLIMDSRDSVKLPDLCGKAVFSFVKGVFKGSCTLKNSRLIDQCKIPVSGAKMFNAFPSLSAVRTHLQELEEERDYNFVRFDSAQVSNQDIADLLTRLWVEYIDATVKDLRQQ